MASLKSITNLPIVESAEGVNLIVEDNGVAKRIAADAAGLGAGGTSDAVQYIEQELTEEQQIQARKNLGLYYKKVEQIDIVPEQDVWFDLGKGQVVNVHNPYLDDGVDIEAEIPIKFIYKNTLLDGLLTYQGEAVVRVDLSSIDTYGMAEIYLETGVIQGLSLDQETASIHTYCEIGEIEKVPLDCIDAVQYVEQTLTEGQITQARKNLGLYAEYEGNKCLASVGPETSGQAIDVSDNSIALNTSLIIKVTDYKDKSISYEGECERVSNMDDIPNVGEIYYNCWGNMALIENDSEAWSYFSSVLDDNKYNDLPFVLYYVDDEVAGTTLFRIYLSSELQPTYWIGFDIEIFSSEKITIYDTIPEEFIPESIARVSDIPQIAVAVSDATGETVTAAEFNALLTALRDANIISTT